MPTRPKSSPGNPEHERRDVQPTVDEVEQQYPYQKIASDLRGAIESGILGAGDALPAEKTLAARYGVAASTAHRAIEFLVKSGFARSASGHRTLVATIAPEASQAPRTHAR
jgi:DNA-binding GntR family transcriptional regulator